MNRLFFPLTFPKRSHLLWLAWLRALQPLRPACSRTTTFLWLVVVLAALCLRPDLAGVTSLVRSLGLSDASYYCLLHFFNSPALNLERLTQLWRQTLQHLFRRCLVQVKGRPVVLVDGLKRPKEGRKMPAVKSLHQESRCIAKASFIKEWPMMKDALALQRDSKCRPSKAFTRSPAAMPRRPSSWAIPCKPSPCWSKQPASAWPFQWLPASTKAWFGAPATGAPCWINSAACCSD